MLFSYSISVHSDLEVAGLFKAGVRMHRWPYCGFMMKAVEGREEVRCCHALIPLFAHQSQHPGFGSAKACPDNELGLLILYSIEAWCVLSHLPSSRKAIFFPVKRWPDYYTVPCRNRPEFVCLFIPKTGFRMLQGGERLCSQEIRARVRAACPHHPSPFVVKKNQTEWWMVGVVYKTIEYV